MKLKTEDIAIESGGIAEEGEFRIKASATAFAILSSGLYSNKFKAILRELGCNAYDSHVEAGYPEKPFTVHLPTRLNPVLSIRDYGIGLSHKDVMGLYTTYFESTKNDSNEFVGCMGLGSKSPFSYTKNFTITSIKDGKKGIYSAYIGKDGVPNVGLLGGLEETDEHNGVEVSFAVEESYDMRSFKHEVSDTFKWFKTKPEITGEPCNIPDIDYSQKDLIPGVNMRDAHNRYNAKSHAVMGNVAYPINVPDSEELPEGIRELLHNNSFDIEFEIGELDIAASREELGYTDETVAALVTKAEAIFGALEVFVTDKLNPAKTKWERVILASDLMQSNTDLFSELVKRYVKKYKAKFPKETVENYYGLKCLFPIVEAEKIDGMRINFKSIRQHCNPVQLGTIKSESQLKPGLQNNAKKRTNTPMDYRDVFSLDPRKDVIVFNDEKGNVLSRIRAAVSDRSDDTFKKYDNVLVAQAQNQKVDKKKIAKFLKTRFPGAPIILASQLPVVIGTGSATAFGNVSITVQKFDTKRTSSWRDDGKTFNALYSKVKDIEPSIIKGRKRVWLYVPLTHKQILMPGGGSWTASHFYKIIEQNDIHKMVGIATDLVYGLNKTSIKSVTADKRWVNYFDYIRKQFDAVDWKIARKLASDRLIESEFSHEDFKPDNKHWNEMRKIAKRKTAAGRLFKAFITWKDNIDSTVRLDIKYDRVIIAMNELYDEDFSKSSANLDVKSFGDKYSKLFEKFKAKYPMIQYANLDDSYRGEEDWTNVLQYIKVVDKAS